VGGRRSKSGLGEHGGSSAIDRLGPLFFWVVFIYLFIFIVVGTAVGVDSGGFTLG
jgi:hypothetical protein